MAATRKLYIEIAESFRIVANNYGVSQVWSELLSSIMMDLKKDNPNFDKARFSDACRPTIEKLNK